MTESNDVNIAITAAARAALEELLDPKECGQGINRTARDILDVKVAQMARKAAEMVLSLMMKKDQKEVIVTKHETKVCDGVTIGDIFQELKNKGILEPLRNVARLRYWVKFCDYHQHYSHSTNDCYTLKKKLMDLILEGKLEVLLDDDKVETQVQVPIFIEDDDDQVPKKGDSRKSVFTRLGKRSREKEQEGGLQENEDCFKDASDVPMLPIETSKLSSIENTYLSEDPLLVLPMFDGSHKPNKFVALFEEVVCHPRLYGIDIGKLFGLFLEGKALEWYRIFTEVHGYDWKLMKSSIIRRFRSARKFISGGPGKKGRYIFE